ncbi:MAG: hypothetical protein QOJ94_1720 [Sphingomonadales bacterium]|nr:hypothetical protein [Sphingomonadales bacterium]
MARYDKWLPLIGFTFACLGATSCSRPSPTQAVEQRFDAYMNAWLKRDLDDVWKLTSSRVKRGNDNNKSSFRQFAEEQNIYFVSYKKISTEVEGSHARVIADMAMTDSAKTAVMAERQKCDLVLEKGTWYVDDCKPLNPPV